MAFKMKNPSMAKMAKMAGDNRVAMKMKMESAAKMKKEAAMKLKKDAPMKRAGYYEYDEFGNKKQITTDEYNKKKETASGRTITAGRADDKGTPGNIVADMSHGKAELDKTAKKGDKTSQAVKKDPQHKKNVEEGTKPRGQRGTHIKTTRYKEDAKQQAEFDKKRKTGDKSSPANMKKSSMKMGHKSPAKLKKKDSAAKFNAKLKAASKAGKLSGKFKEAVDAAPVKMKKSPAKLTKNLKEAAKVTKAQLKGEKIKVVDGGSKMAKKAKADYEKQQAKKKAKADTKAKSEAVMKEARAYHEKQRLNKGMSKKDYDKMLKRKQRKAVFGF